MKERWGIFEWTLFAVLIIGAGYLVMERDRLQAECQSAEDGKQFWYEQSEAASSALATAQLEVEHYKRISMSQAASRLDSDPMLLDTPWAIVPCDMPRSQPPETAEEFAELWRHGDCVVYKLDHNLSFAIVENAAADDGLRFLQDDCFYEDPLVP